MGLCDYVDEKGVRCKKVANCGYTDGKRIRCTNHRNPGMIHKTCDYCACGVIAYFGLPSDPKPSRCKKCKTAEMVNIKAKKCFCGKKRASFGLPGTKKSTHCLECKTLEMVQVMNLTCKCGRRARFGMDGKVTHCLRCKKQGMTNLRRPNCKCGVQASFRLLPKKTPTHCVSCKTPEMVTISKKCRANEPPHNIPCPMTANRRYDNYCCRCFGYLFPSHPKTAWIRGKSKELTVVSHITSRFAGFLHDKPLYTKDCDCSHRRRIDLRTIIEGTLLCIEIDEGQHKYYQDKDRYDDLYMMFSGKMIFIRYNPDRYRDRSWNLKNPQSATRLKRLEQEVKTQTERILSGKNIEPIEVIQLYFDEISDPGQSAPEIQTPEPKAEDTPHQAISTDPPYIVPEPILIFTNKPFVPKKDPAVAAPAPAVKVESS